MKARSKENDRHYANKVGLVILILIEQANLKSKYSGGQLDGSRCVSFFDDGVWLTTIQAYSLKEK